MKSIQSSHTTMRNNSHRKVSEMMQINSIPNSTIVTYHPFFAPLSFRLEEEFPKETEILDIEIEISEGGKKEHEIDDLKKKRNDIIKEWINTITEDMLKTKNDEKKRSLKRELDRAMSYQHNL